MVSGPIKSLTVEGYTSIRSAHVELGALTVLIGPNGAGKSNFVSAFELLGRLADEGLRLFVGLRGGAGVLLHGGASAIGIEVDASPYRYTVCLRPTARDELLLEDEEIAGQGGTFRLGEGSAETKLLRESDSVAERAVASEILRLLNRCRVHHFHDTGRTAPVRRYADPADNLELRPDAANLAAYLMRVADEDVTTYRRIVRIVRQVAPFFQDFVLAEERAGVRVRWRQVGFDGVLGAESLSDGTLRFICLATLLLKADAGPLVILDEPELGLHPLALVQLAGMLRSASQSRQIVVSTQSVTLVDQMDLDDIVVVEREDGASAFRRPEPASLAAWLDDYSLGDLWQKNLLGGRRYAALGS